MGEYKMLGHSNLNSGLLSTAWGIGMKMLSEYWMLLIVTP